VRAISRQCGYRTHALREERPLPRNRQMLLYQLNRASVLRVWRLPGICADSDYDRPNLRNLRDGLQQTLSARIVAPACCAAEVLIDDDPRRWRPRLADSLDQLSEKCSLGAHVLIAPVRWTLRRIDFDDGREAELGITAHGHDSLIEAR